MNQTSSNFSIVIAFWILAILTPQTVLVSGYKEVVPFSVLKQSIDSYLKISNALTILGELNHPETSKYAIGDLLNLDKSTMDTLLNLEKPEFESVIKEILKMKKNEKMGDLKRFLEGLEVLEEFQRDYEKLPKIEESEELKDQFFDDLEIWKSTGEIKDVFQEYIDKMDNAMESYKIAPLYNESDSDTKNFWKATAQISTLIPKIPEQLESQLKPLKKLQGFEHVQQVLGSFRIRVLLHRKFLKKYNSTSMKNILKAIAPISNMSVRAWDFREVAKGVSAMKTFHETAGINYIAGLYEDENLQIFPPQNSSAFKIFKNVTIEYFKFRERFRKGWKGVEEKGNQTKILNDLLTSLLSSTTSSMEYQDALKMAPSILHGNFTFEFQSGEDFLDSFDAIITGGLKVRKAHKAWKEYENSEEFQNLPEDITKANIIIASQDRDKHDGINSEVESLKKTFKTVQAKLRDVSKEFGNPSEYFKAAENLTAQMKNASDWMDSFEKEMKNKSVQLGILKSGIKFVLELRKLKNNSAGIILEDVTRIKDSLKMKDLDSELEWNRMTSLAASWGIRRGAKLRRNLRSADVLFGIFEKYLTHDDCLEEMDKLDIDNLTRFVENEGFENPNKVGLQLRWKEFLEMLERRKIFSKVIRNAFGNRNFSLDYDAIGFLIEDTENLILKFPVIDMENWRAVANSLVELDHPNSSIFSDEFLEKILTFCVSVDLDFANHHVMDTLKELDGLRRLYEELSLIQNFEDESYWTKNWRWIVMCSFLFVVFVLSVCGLVMATRWGKGKKDEE